MDKKTKKIFIISALAVPVAGFALPLIFTGSDNRQLFSTLGLIGGLILAGPGGAMITKVIA